MRPLPISGAAAFSFRRVHSVRLTSHYRWLLLGEKYGQYVRRSRCGYIPELLHGPATQRMGYHRVGIIRDAAECRHRVCACNEWFGADHGSRDSAPFQGQSVVHTAR